jgi:hypothetical protein
MYDTQYAQAHDQIRTAPQFRNQADILLKDHIAAVDILSAEHAVDYLDSILKDHIAAVDILHDIMKN